jgi:hypothetical protein
MSRTAEPKEIAAGEATHSGDGSDRRKPWVWPRCEVLPFEDTEKQAAAGPDGFGSLS